MDNHGCYIVSLGNVCRWLGQQAEALGVEIYPGFAAAEILYDDHGAVRGVATGDMGVAKDGTHKPDYQPGMELHAKYTLFAEGCRGSLSQELMQKFNLRDGIDPQKYGIGLKELWQVAPDKHQKGLVMHSQGWPLDSRHRRRLVPVSPGRQPGRRRLRRAPELRESAPVAVRRIPALQDASGDPSDVRRRQAPGLRRARDQRGRTAIGAEARLSGRRAHRLRGRIRQPAADQGQPQRDEDRHARRRIGVRRARRGPRARRTRRLSRRLAQVVGVRRPVQGAQREARPQMGHVGGHRCTAACTCG